MSKQSTTRRPGASSLGALAVGAAAFGAVAIGALAIRRLAIGRGKIGRLTIGELDVGRLRVGELVVQSRREPHPFDALEGESYVSLETFRKSGEAVATPVWFVLSGGRLYMTTPHGSGKMKRIRNDPRVRLTPCNALGRTHGGTVEGVARPLADGEAPAQARRAFEAKYRLGLGLFRFFGKGQIEDLELGDLTLEVQPEAQEEGG